MKRPLEDARPVGPFAQSGTFSDQFLGSGSSETFQRGDEGTISIVPPPSGFGARRPEDAAEFFIEQELEDFVNLQIEASGMIDGLQGEQWLTYYFVVEDVSDRDVTVAQVEEAIEQFVSREEGAAIKTVNVHKTSYE